MLHPDPFRDIDRLAAQLLGTSPGSARVPLAMPMDLYRSGDHYVLHADLPGVDPDSVDVSVDGGVLTVTAQRSERTEHDVQWLSSERFTGGYMRRLSLGQDIDADHITATYFASTGEPLAGRRNRCSRGPGAVLEKCSAIAAAIS